ncbi:MAG: homoserine O-acetyltransferase/O-succinyltransferase family protein [Streptococcus sp.]
MESTRSHCQRKLSGIYKQTVDMPENFLMNGFDDSFVSPHSRYTEVTLEDIKNKTDLDIVVSGPESRFIHLSK